MFRAVAACSVIRGGIVRSVQYKAVVRGIQHKAVVAMLEVFSIRLLWHCYRYSA